MRLGRFRLVVKVFEMPRISTRLQAKTAVADSMAGPADLYEYGWSGRNQPQALLAVENRSRTSPAVPSPTAAPGRRPVARPGKRVYSATKLPATVGRFTLLRRVEVAAPFGDDPCAGTRGPGSTKLVAFLPNVFDPPQGREVGTRERVDHRGMCRCASGIPESQNTCLST
jgi:hypothetical protein